MSLRLLWPLVAALLWVAVACGSPNQPLGPPRAGESSPGQPGAAPQDDQGRSSTVAEATVPRVPVFDAPGAAAPARTLSHPQPSGAPLVFLVREEQPAWLKVLLPVRPNGSQGWIRRSEVKLYRHDYRILVELAAHQITVFKGNQVFLREPIGVGTRDTPTPGGLYYTKELIEPTDERGRYIPQGPYGTYAYGLSGFSNVLTSFAGGDGVIGIHGTNDPSAIGRDVSAGCIRMSNAGITRLAKVLPLGVPVEIRA